jgi:hypothetical protein
MPASNAFQSDILNLLFENTAIANIGNAGGLQPSSAAGSLYIALHTASPGAGGSQSTNEAAYTGYARVAVSRVGGSWTITGTTPTQIANAAAVTFPACTGGSETETYFSIGYQSSGATKILAFGALTSSLAVSNGITPSFAIGQMACTVD